jgi:hypothetical protein
MKFGRGWIKWNHSLAACLAAVKFPEVRGLCGSVVTEDRAFTNNEF